MWQTAYGNAEAPGFIRRGSTVVRRASATGFKDFTKWTGAPQRRISVFEEDLDLHRQDVIDFIATVKTKHENSLKHPAWMARSRIFPPLYVLSICAAVYFILVGLPLWNGLALTYWRYFSHATHLALATVIFVSWAGLQAFLPIFFCQFEQEVDPVEERDASEVALIIPAYKAAGLIGATIEHALKIFKKEQIFIIANGNSPTPLDNAAEVCAKYGVNHYWVPIGSKITAEFVGVAVAARYKYVMLIDDDVHLPENLPLVTKRFDAVTKCIGYTIKSTGADGIKGTLIQQCQDMEYKSSGLTRDWAGRWGSCTFPHGAIILWEREALQSLFSSHPGFVISEDWYFGHCARQAGYRIAFCSQVFVETETPPCLLWDSSTARGGYGEMTVWKQRFYRWNYFFLFRLYDDMKYLIFNWRLGWREITAKYQVMIEVADSIIGLFQPFIFVISFVLDWRLTLYFMAGLTGMYAYVFVHFNLIQLRRKKEMVSFKIMPTFFFMKFILLWFGSASMYYGMYDYIKYFSKRHPKVIENYEALEAVYNIRLGTNLVPIADTVSEIIEQVEEVQQAREDQAEISVLDRTPSASPGDLEKGMNPLKQIKEEDENQEEQSRMQGFAGFNFTLPTIMTSPVSTSREIFRSPSYAGQADTSIDPSSP